ncbi:hypothetical protein [Oceanobacillus halotolerans]|uniref:hypothetical protein n=1 Tax=Oceanobacillus halotolerans TaxID=2663380 RepID=UPI0013DB8C6D|nr:hypothetical protein [Oceanobacillus halotolerans]
MKTKQQQEIERLERAIHYETDPLLSEKYTDRLEKLQNGEINVNQTFNRNKYRRKTTEPIKKRKPKHPLWKLVQLIYGICKGILGILIILGIGASLKIAYDWFMHPVYFNWIDSAKEGAFLTFVIFFILAALSSKPKDHPMSSRGGVEETY